MGLSILGAECGQRAGRLYEWLRVIFTNEHTFALIGLSSQFDGIWRKWIGRLRRPVSVMVSAGMISILCGILINERAFAVTGFLVILTGLGWILPERSLKSVSLVLRLSDERIAEGESVFVTLEASSIGLLPAAGLTVETGLMDTARSSRGSWEIHLPAFWRERRRYRFEWQALRRGIYPADQAWVSCSFPFQLRTVRKPIGGNNSLIVHPMTYEVPEFPEFLSGVEDYGDVLGRSRGVSGETTTLRSYRQGDDPRRIHWPQTARTGAIIVREQQRAIKPRMTLHLGEAEQYGSWTREWGVRLAASLVKTAFDEGYECALVLGVEGVGARVVRGRNRVEYLDVLAAYGDEAGFVVERSESWNAVEVNEGLQLVITTAGVEVGLEHGKYLEIFLGEVRGVQETRGRVWKSFVDEMSLLSWLRETAK